MRHDGRLPSTNSEPAVLLRHQRAHRSRDLVVEVHDPDATIADLAATLEPDLPPGPLMVEDRLLPATVPLCRAGIADGSVVIRDGSQPPTHPQHGTGRSQGDGRAIAALVVVGGFDAGHRIELSSGSHLLGRSPRSGSPIPTLSRRPIGIEDPTVSSDHLIIDVSPDGSVIVTDLGSTNGTRVDDIVLAPQHPVRWDPSAVLTCGSARLRLVEPVSPVSASGAATPGLIGDRTHPLHRRPRSGIAPVVEPIDLPPAPEAPPPVTPIGLVAVAGSVAVGVVMVLVLGSLTYALFALLGPVLLVANALDSKRRRRRTTRLARRRRRAQLRQLTLDLDAAAEQVRLHRSLRFAGPVSAVTRVVEHPESLWERRRDHDDAFAVRVGTGQVPWRPPTDHARQASEPDVARTLSAASLGITTVGINLAPATPIAVVGSPAATRALVRSLLVQAAVDHGPADLQVAVLASPGTRDAWDWCGWLPHGRDPGAGSLLAGDPTTAERVAAELADGGDDGPLRLVVIDDLDGLGARRGPVRSVLRQATEGSRLVPLVMVPSLDAVPAVVSLSLEVADDGALRVGSDIASGSASVLGVGETTARDVARRLARFDDPEVDDPGRGLPRQVGLAGLLGSDRLLTPVVAARWRAAVNDPPPRAVIGQGADGPVEVDLAADGPHALVAGTTGAGKSELLRTLVASLALTSSPDHLAFVLIDFKGGSAFDACAHLPHVTGVVTDLDEHLAERALRCLEAELHHRESVLRQAGAEDLAAHRRIEPAGDPLPRLVVVIDEFATLATELPDFVDSLVGVAQRGRSLGVHLVLATQRPTGSVNDKIRANTALRVALRVQDRADSSDVIDMPDAAEIPRQVPGRALVRFGPGETVAVQTALATARTDARTDPIEVAPLGIASSSPPLATLGVGGNDDDPTSALTDLERLVTATIEAWRELDGLPPRSVWPDALPTDLPWPVGNDEPGIAPSPATEDLVLGMADDPDRQRRIPFVWRPGEGPLLVAGAPGAGATTALCTVALAASATWSVTDAHIYAIDLGAGDLGTLGDLAAVGHVVSADDEERQRRLIDHLSDVLTARRSSTGNAWSGPRLILIVDGIRALRDRWDPLEPTGTWDRFVELATRGAPFGIHAAMSAEGAGAAPQSLLSACGQRLVLRLGERTEASMFGVSPAAVPPPSPGRGVAAECGLVVQVARPTRGVAAEVAKLARAAAPADSVGGPRAIGVLPEKVTGAVLGLRGDPLAEQGPDGTLRVAVGIADRRLTTARLVLPPGGHALIAGPPRSGRTSTLHAITEMLTTAGVTVVKIQPGHGPNRDELAVIEGPEPVVITVDDVDRTADDDPLLNRLATERRPGRHLLVAGRVDLLRSRYAHWTREVRVDRCGVLLAPDPDLDGDLLGTRVPRAWPVAPRPGLAWLAGGEPEGVIQLATSTT